MINKIFFIYFAIAIVTLSLVIITRKSLVHSVLFMLALFFHIAGLYLFLNAEFLALVQIIVYAGAILVLFLFVIMLLNIREDELKEQYSSFWPAGISIGIVFLIVLLRMPAFSLGIKGVWDIKSVTEATSTGAIGQVLYTEYLLPFEVASLILLIAIIGAIILAKKRFSK
ncbi:MAG: NADH-quinone oxidoreductase subunit J [Nitrospirae bacterium]|nr:NADH-quinone oxidoreductase subunit J [Nitrospirota bacterium]MBF0540090.1 NADH-quinone oxidoreductase subunit J [Nitrospirota bacterium]